MSQPMPKTKKNSKANLKEPKSQSLAHGHHKSAKNIVLRLFRRHAVLLFIALLCVFFSLTSPSTFPTLDNMRGIALGQSVSALLALSVLLVVVIGEFDLSVGYTLGFSAVVTAKLSGGVRVPVGASILVALLIGAAIGMLSGVLVSRLKVNSLIATLGVGLAVSGLSVGVSGGQILSSNIPNFIISLSRGRFLGIEGVIWILLLVATVTYLIFVKTPLGQKLYATGGSEVVARMVGIRVNLLKISVFAVAGLIAALAGILQLGLSGAADPSYGSNLLLPAFAAVFLGSTTVRPGFFNVWGTILSIILLAIGFSGMSLLGVPFWVQPIFDGFALIIGVLLSKWSAKNSQGVS